AINATITDPKKTFVHLGPPVDGSLARAAGEHLGANAMILETTTRGQPLSFRARQHRVMVRTLLLRLKMIDATVTADTLAASTAPGRLRVAVYDAAGTGGSGVARVTELLTKSGTADVVAVGPDDVRGGALDSFDVVMCTGGSGSAQAKAIGEDGRARSKQFVESGGGYVGICAGSYLACSGFSWGIGVLDAGTVSPKWKRGTGTVEIELTDE